MSEVKITFRGWGGHFICANRCRFRLNTLVEYGEIRIVVSTVGLMEPLRDGDKFQEIGFDRYFETMAFHAKREKEFWDADVSRQVYFDSPWSYDSPDSEWAANKGHYVVVEEISEGLKRGLQYITEDES